MIRRSTWVVLGVFAVFLLIVVLRQQSQEQLAAKVTPTNDDRRPFLFELGGAQMTALRVSDGQGNVIILQRGDGGVWKLIDPPLEPTDDNAVNTLITQLVSLQAVTQLDAPPALEAMGLNPPANGGILITLDNGRQLVASVGKLAATGNGYYVLTSDRKVYVVSNSSLETILGMAAAPPVVLPTIEAPVDLFATPVP